MPSAVSVPSQAWPPPWPLLLASLVKTSTLAPANRLCPAALPTWPVTASWLPRTRAAVSTGWSINWLGWPLVLAPSFTLTPLSARSMPICPLPQMALREIRLLPAPVSTTPGPLLPRIRLPAPAPPTVLPLASACRRTPALPLGTTAVPAASTPMWLPCSRLPVADAPTTCTPSLPLPAITLRSAAVWPPITLPADSTRRPALPLASANVPVTSSPMVLPVTSDPLAPLSSSRFSQVLPLMTLPMNWLPALAT